MGKNKILISCGGLRIGGLEKLLVEYANFISENNSYDVILFLIFLFVLEVEKPASIL